MNISKRKKDIICRFHNTGLHLILYYVVILILVEGWCWSLVGISRNLDVLQKWYGCQVLADGLLERVV